MELKQIVYKEKNDWFSNLTYWQKFWIFWLSFEAIFLIWCDIILYFGKGGK